jgi:predicted Zn-dependent peptidase
MITDEPESWVGVLSDQLMFGDHPLGSDVLGTEASLKSMARAPLADYMATHYRPNNTVVALVGAFDSVQALDLIETQLGDWEAAPTPGFAPAPAYPPGPHLVTGRRAIEQAHIRLSVPGLSALDPERHALQILCAVLGDGMSSRLFLDLRERAALAYNVYCDDNYLRDTGIVTLYAAVDPPRAVKTVRALLSQLWRLRDEPVPAQELLKTKEFLKGGILLRLEDTAEIAMSLAGQAVVREEVLTAADMVARVDDVTAAEMQGIAQRLFSLDRLFLTVVGPFDGPARFIDLLKEVK